ncbi:hypothetical protein C8J57DRAFT_1522506 [Mycena rebaudengoi]|nr:hypothetical protein C8J57DRAFT_1522506 [Mycena rebaudengoi]
MQAAVDALTLLPIPPYPESTIQQRSDIRKQNYKLISAAQEPYIVELSQWQDKQTPKEWGSFSNTLPLASI